LKKDQFIPLRSSMLGMSKDAALIMDRILSNRELLKLLVYNTRDWKEQPDVTKEQIREMFTTH